MKSENKKKNKSGSFSNPLNGAKQKVRVIKLSFTNILLIAVVVISLFFLVNNALQPSLGDQVSVDEFLQNIEDNRYREVAIRNDGNAVGYGKTMNLLQLETDEDLTKTKKNIEDRLSEIDLDKKEVKHSEDLEYKDFSDVIAEIKPAENLSEALADLRDSFTQQDTIQAIYLLDNSVIADWKNPETKDWLVENMTEVQVEEQLIANNLDLSSLEIEVVNLRTAGVFADNDQFVDSLEADRYNKIWSYDQKIYTVIDVTKIPQNYVNYGTATQDFTKLLQEEDISLGGINYNVVVQPINQIDLVTIFNFLFIAVLAFLGYMLLRSVNSSGSGLMRFGQSKARMFFGQKMEVKFDDVAGVDEAKEELKEVVDFLKHPEKYRKLGAKIPRGVLMVGEPGTGKTLMARAVAGEAGVPFFHTSGSEFEEMLVGAGASRVRDLFEKAKKASPALIFIDEIDAVGRKRGTTIQSSSTEQTLNQILVEMDGFEARDNVIVIAATNRPDVLDPAILRPGRFDRKVVLDKPDIVGRIAIIKIHSANKPIAKDVDFEDVAKRTVGFTGADLENMLNEAAILVAKEGRKEITKDDIEEAATKVQTGRIRNRKRTDEELKMTAYHEAGHAIVMHLTPKSDPVHRITILSRGRALGYVMPLPQTDELQMTKTKMESKIRSLLAGYASEEMYFGDVTTGASNDIEKATNIARRMVTQFGMSKALGLVKYGSDEDESQIGWNSGSKGYSEDTAKTIDNEVRRIIDEAFVDTKKILEENKKIHEKLVNELLEKEVLDGEEFMELFPADKQDIK